MEHIISCSIRRFFFPNISICEYDAQYRLYYVKYRMGKSLFYIFYILHKKISINIYSIAYGGAEYSPIPYVRGLYNGIYAGYTLFKWFCEWVNDITGCKCAELYAHTEDDDDGCI